MSAKGIDRLRTILKTYEDRSAKRRPESAVVHDEGEGERRRRACGDRLRNVVRAVLQDFVAELREAGHDASVDDLTDAIDAYPSVALVFTPRIPGGKALASVLTFRCDPRRGIAVARDVKASARRGRVVTSGSDRIGTMRVDGASPEWVETKALSFIEMVLGAE
jgi:hypothetical protein